MKHSIVNLPAGQIEADAIVVGVYADGSLTDAAREIDETAANIISRLLAAKEISGKPHEITSILAPQGVSATQVVVVGLGNPGHLNQHTAFRTAACAARHLAKKARPRIAFLLDSFRETACQEAAIAGATIGCVGQDLYRAEKSTYPFTDLFWPPNYQASLAAGSMIGESVNLTRRLVNEPPNMLYPESFAERVRAVAQATGMEIEIWDEQQLAAEKCGALLAVGRGSARPPRLAILRLLRGAPGATTLGLVGKGVTFDSGGLSLKPSDGMKTMKCDMAGAGTVVGAMQAIAALEISVNVIGVLGLVENMPSRDAFKLGDVVTARNGVTIEIQNTDAEGRLVLADALCVARDQGADKLIDLATLTGACVVALGEEISGLMTNQQDWCDTVRAAAAATGEDVWQLPMSSDFDEQIKSEVADIKNVGAGRWGGAITAAKLLERFVADKPWVHLDIAGPSFRESPKAWADAGATGVMVRTLVELARQIERSARQPDVES